MWGQQKENLVRSGTKRQLCALLRILLCRVRLIKFAGELLTGLFTECFFEEAARVAAGISGEPLGFDAGLPVRLDDDFDLRHAAPPFT